MRGISKELNVAQMKKYTKGWRISMDLMHDTVMLIDFLTIVLAALLAKLIYIDWYLGPEKDIVKYITPALLSACIFCYLSAQRALYTYKNINNSRKFIFSSILNIAITFLIVIAVGYAFKFAHLYSRGWTFAWVALSVLLILVNRWSINRTITWLRHQGYIRRQSAIICHYAEATKLSDAIRAVDPESSIVGVFNEDASDSYTGNISDIIRIAQEGNLDEVYIAIPFDKQDEIGSAIERLRFLPVEIWVYSPDQKLPAPIRDFVQLGSITALKIQAKPISDRGLVLKAIEDYFIGTLSLIVFAPIFALIAIAIKLDSKGPVFFRQKRHGTNNKVINVWKFRTMTVMEDDASVVQATREDKRVTRIGKILRKTSLDELPQIINVLKGEMSLVGPRPHALAHNDHYAKILDFYDHRHRVKPGITGWAQINGYRGPTDTPELMHRRVQLDLYYIDNWSIWLDLKILIATPFLGFLHKNAI
jgi:putative colanic acid biosynthesis UDP-glucose lipid carrier transferase